MAVASKHPVRTLIVLGIILAVICGIFWKVAADTELRALAMLAEGVPGNRVEFEKGLKMYYVMISAVAGSASVVALVLAFHSALRKK